jgi:hypothetical protein
MADFGLNMTILVSNMNHCGQADLSSIVRHRAFTHNRLINSRLFYNYHFVTISFPIKLGSP